MLTTSAPLCIRLTQHLKLTMTLKVRDEWRLSGPHCHTVTKSPGAGSCHWFWNKPKQNMKPLKLRTLKHQACLFLRSRCQLRGCKYHFNDCFCIVLLIFLLVVFFTSLKFRTLLSPSIFLLWWAKVLCSLCTSRGVYFFVGSCTAGVMDFLFPLSYLRELCVYCMLKGYK